jgi:hypothetical protein
LRFPGRRYSSASSRGIGPNPWCRQHARASGTPNLFCGAGVRFWH